MNNRHSCYESLDAISEYLNEISSPVPALLTPIVHRRKSDHVRHSDHLVARNFTINSPSTKYRRISKAGGRAAAYLARSFSVNNAQNQRPKKNPLSSIFNDDVESSSPVSNKSQSMTRKSGVASGYNKDENNRTLGGLLSHYQFSHSFNDESVDGYENSLEDTFLEESWTDVITEYEGMTSKDKIQQETIWELLITERNYLRKIRVIIAVFQNCLISLQKENFLEEVELDKLFANIKEVYDTNYTFWEDYLKHVTEEARKTKQPIKPSQLHDSFACFEELFQPYIRYCLEEGSCMKYLKQLKRENELFQEYLAWCENHRQCMRLKLADLFVKPMQRVTKYALLLKAVLGKTTDEEEKVSLENMIFQVDRFVTKINTTLRLRNEQQRLDDVLERIETYTPIEAANEEMEKLLESQYCHFDLHGNIPGLPEEEQRCILLDGPMKLIEKQGRILIRQLRCVSIQPTTKTSIK